MVTSSYFAAGLSRSGRSAACLEELAHFARVEHAVAVGVAAPDELDHVGVGGDVAAEALAEPVHVLLGDHPRPVHINLQPGPTAGRINPIIPPNLSDHFTRI